MELHLWGLEKLKKYTHVAEMCFFDFLQLYEALKDKNIPSHYYLVHKLRSNP